MRVFVTGATGSSDRPSSASCSKQGHDVIGLARSDKAAAGLAAAGAEVHRGDLTTSTAFGRGGEADGVIHTAFTNFSPTTDPAAVHTDVRAVEAIGSPLDGSGRPFVVTSGTGWSRRAAWRRRRHRAGRCPGPRSEPRRSPSRARGTRVRVRLPRPCTARATRLRPGPDRHRPREGLAGTSATGRTAGPPCTGSTPRACSGWPRRPRPRARACTESPTRACRSATSPRSSAATWTCRWSASPATRQTPTSAGFALFASMDVPGQQRDHPAAVRLAPRPARAHRGPRRGPLLQA